MNHSRTTCIHASKLKLGLKVEEGCSYYLVMVLVPQYCELSHYKINLITSTHLICTTLRCSFDENLYHISRESHYYPVLQV
jgi:hypothetical protein